MDERAFDAVFGSMAVAGMRRHASRRGPTSRDLSRLVLARASARMVVERANGVFEEAILTAFRAEIGATVRKASPLLLALLEQEGLSIDDLAWQLRPAEGWPYKPILPASGTKFRATERDIAYRVISFERTGRPFDTPVGEWHGVELSNQHGDRLGMHVVDHAIEMAASLDGDWYTTLHGSAKIEIRRLRLNQMPSARVGRPLEEALARPAFRGRRWLMDDVSEPLEYSGIEIMVRTGMRPYRLPWVR